jgi:hypothetical protein
MKMRFALVLFGVAALGGCQVAPSAPFGVANGPLRLKPLGATPDGVRFRLSNTSGSTVQYVHWLGQGPEPVPYCKYADGTTCPCSKAVYLIENEYYVHERPLKPKQAVTFDAVAADAVAVGVAIWVDDKKQYIWSLRLP